MFYQNIIDNLAPQKTSLNQVAAGLRLAVTRNLFRAGSTILDIGGGRFDKGIQYLNEHNIIGLVYDPYARTSEHNRKVLNQIRANGGADGIALNNVLNVIPDPTDRRKVLQFAYSQLKPNGYMVITVYEGNGSGEGSMRHFSDGTVTWQENRKLATYEPEIKSALPGVNLVRTGNALVIRKR